MDLQIPSLGLDSRVIMVYPADGGYPVEALGSNAGLLADTALPGEGVSVIAAHNTLSADETGPFAMIFSLSEGDHFFLRREDGKLLIFEVYASRKIGAFDHAALAETAGQFSSTVTLMTCEDELAEGGYASRRIVSGKQIN